MQSASPPDSLAPSQPHNPVRATPLLNKSDDDLNELVVRESSTGNVTLSIVADEELFHILKSIRKGNQESLKHLATIQKSAIQGFSHSRYNLLVDNQLPFTISSAILFPTAVLLFFPVTAIFGLFTFTASLIFAGFAVMAKTRPHTLTIHTSGGPIKTHFFESQSNGYLMTSTMGSIDGILSDYIQTGILEVPQMAPPESFIPITIPSMGVLEQTTLQTSAEENQPPSSETPIIEMEEATPPNPESLQPVSEKPPSAEVLTTPSPLPTSVPTTPPSSPPPTSVPTAPPPSPLPTSVPTAPPPPSPPPAALPMTPPPPSPPPAALPMTPPPPSPPPSEIPPPPPPPPTEPRADSISTEEKDDLLDALND